VLEITNATQSIRVIRREQMNTANISRKISQADRSFVEKEAEGESSGANLNLRNSSQHRQAPHSFLLPKKASSLSLSLSFSLSLSLSVRIDETVCKRKNRGSKFTKTKLVERA